jgi:hypothetical protein
MIFTAQQAVKIGGHVMTSGVRAFFLVAAILAPASQAVAQNDAAKAYAAQPTVEWVCNVTDPNAAAPDFVFESRVRVVQKDFQAFWMLPPKGQETQNVTRTYTLIENNEYGMVAVMPVKHLGDESGFGIEMLILNKTTGGFRAGGSVVGGHYTNAEGNCKRK